MSGALVALPDDADLPTVVDLARRLLGRHWPERPSPAETVARVVDKLRYLAVTRVGPVRDARFVVGRRD